MSVNPKKKTKKKTISYQSLSSSWFSHSREQKLSWFSETKERDSQPTSGQHPAEEDRESP